MATETKFIDGVTFTVTGLTGAYTTIDNDPHDNADSDWLISSGSNGTMLASFGAPSGNLTTGAGLQLFEILMRRDAASSGTGVPTVDIWLYENGSPVGAAPLLTGASITSDTGEVISVTWDASLLGTPPISGANVEIFCDFKKGGGGPNERNGEIGGVAWDLDYVVASTPLTVTCTTETLDLANTNAAIGADRQANCTTEILDLANTNATVVKSVPLVVTGTTEALVIEVSSGLRSPDSVGTLLLWLDATDTTTLWQDTGKITPADTPNDPISLWEDKSSNGNDWTRPATTERPFYREDFNTSYPAVWFDGFNDSLFGSMSEPANDWTILAVVDANNSTGYIADWQTGRLLLGHSSNQFGYNDGSPVVGATLPNVPSITTFRLNSPSGSVQINQTETASGSYTQRALGGSSALGERYSADNFQWSGWISSLIIYQGNLSESQIAGVEAYLADRYGIGGIGAGSGTTVQFAKNVACTTPTLALTATNAVVATERHAIGTTEILDLANTNATVSFGRSIGGATEVLSLAKTNATVATNVPLTVTGATESLSLANTNATVLAGPAPSYGAVKSIEVVLAYHNANGQMNIALTKGQDPTQCVPLHMTMRFPYTYGTAVYGGMSISVFDVDIYDNAGTPTLGINRTTTQANIYPLYVQVAIVEFVSDIRVQKIAFDSGASFTSAVATIPTAIDLSRTFITAFPWNKTNSGTNYGDDRNFQYKLNSTTQFQVTRQTGAGTTYQGWAYLAEDTSAGGNYFTVAHYNRGATYSTSTTQAITSVDTSKAMLIYSNSFGNVNSGVASLASCQIESATAIRINCYSATYPHYYSFQVVEWQNNTTVQRGDHTWSTAGGSASLVTHTATISTVDLANALVRFPKIAESLHTCDRTDSGTAANYWAAMANTVELQDTTTIAFKAWDAGTWVWGHSFPWEVVSFELATDSSLTVTCTTEALDIGIQNATVTKTLAVTGATESLSLANTNATVTTNVPLDVSGTTESLSLANTNATITTNVPLDVSGTTEALALANTNATIATNVPLVVTSTTEALTLANTNATITALIPRIVTGTTEALSLTNTNATVSTNVPLVVASTTEALALTNTNATVTTNVPLDVTGTTEALTLTNTNATIATNVPLVVTSTTEVLALANTNATISAAIPRDVVCTTEALTLASQSGTVSFVYQVVGSSQTLALTPATGSVVRTHPIPGTTEALDLAVQNAVVAQDRGVSGIPEALHLAKTNATIIKGSGISGTTEVLALATTPATVNRAVTVAAQTEQLVITPVAAGVNGTRITTATVELTVLADNDAVVGLSRNVVTATKALTITATSATIGQGFVVSCGTVGLQLGSTIAGVNGTRDVGVAPSVLQLISGSAVVITRRTVDAVTASLVLTNSLAVITLDLRVSAATETLLLTPLAAGVVLGFPDYGNTAPGTLIWIRPSPQEIIWG